ncbi:MAG: substrate-binding domain-containing protein [Myxococcota bacterium]
MLLTSKQVAALLNVHPKHVYRLMKRGLPAARVGSEWRFDREVVLAWSRGEQASAARAPSASSDAAPPPLIAANGDLVIDELLRALHTSGGPFLGFVLADHTTGQSHLQNGRVLFSGNHEDVDPESNANGRAKRVRLHLATREIGLATNSRQPLKKLSSICGRRLALRPATAGIRMALDAALESAGISSGAAYEHAHEYASHRDVALAVAGGEAEVGLTTHAWAVAAGLAFHALSAEAYGLCVGAECLGDPRVVRVCETAQTASFRKRLRDEYGYGVAHTGELLFS